MTYSKELLQKMKVASALLEPPANDVVSELVDEIDRLNTENARLTAAHKWVSVNERLPDDKGEYLCYLKPDIFTSFYGDSWDGNLAFRSVIAPTHWQPLPTPPTGGENE